MTRSGPWQSTARHAQRSHRGRGEACAADRCVEQLSPTREGCQRGSFRDALTDDVKDEAFQPVGVVQGDTVGAPVGADRSVQCREFDHRGVRREQVSAGDHALVGPVVTTVTHGCPCRGLRPERREHTPQLPARPDLDFPGVIVSMDRVAAVICVVIGNQPSAPSRRAALRMTLGR